MRITEQQRRQTEDRIRGAADRLLRGEIPAGGGCDVKTLAAEAGVSRAALYSTYPHLKEDFERRRENLRATGHVPDPRLSQIAGLKRRMAALQARITKQQSTIDELEGFRTVALSRLAAQHDEIRRLRRSLHVGDNVRGISSPAGGQSRAAFVERDNRPRGS